MLQDLDQIFVVTLTLEQIIGNTIIALICGFLVAVFYRWSYRGPSYSPQFLQGLVLLVLITSFVIEVIGSNLARAFGLVGAMSIIRFRTAVKDTQDIIFIFFALACGLAAGAGLYAVAITGTLVVGITAIALAQWDFGKRNRREYLLQMHYQPEGDGEAHYLPVLRKHCKKYKIINLGTAGENEPIELSFYVYLLDPHDGNKMVSDLRKIASISRVNLFYDEEQY